MTDNRPVIKPRMDVRLALALWVASLAIYAPYFAGWSLSGDEFYTFEDSTFSIAKMLSFNSRPLYFIVCHYLLKWNPGLPIEMVIRLPAMLAASLVAPCIYALMGSGRSCRTALFAALLAMCNPWVFQMSQFGRYYAFVIFFATIATIAGFRFVEDRRLIWPITLLVSGLLSAASHPPSVLVIPASILGWIAIQFWQNPRSAWGILRKYSPWLIAAAVAAAALGFYLLQDVIREWSAAGKSDFGGGYDFKSILMSLAVVGGLSSWAMATIPLLRSPKAWSMQDVFLIVLLVFGTLPLLMLVPFGGGVSSRYLLYCLPCMFLLAGRHWAKIDNQLPTFGYRLALGCAIVGCNVPQLMSVATDGDHFDHRAMARAIEELDLENPIVFSSDHRLVDYYLDDRVQIMSNDEDDLGLLGERLPKSLIERGIELANSQNRPLLLVSRQDRALLSMDDQAWLYARFAVLRTIERARYDHRRHRIVLYHYRPMGDTQPNDGARP